MSSQKKGNEMGKTMKNLGLATLAVSIALLTGCGGGGGDSDPMKDKNYILIYTNIPTGICESDILASELSSDGLRNFITRETDTTTSCATYGKANDGVECASGFIGGGNTNCVIGFNEIPPGYNGLAKQTEPVKLYDTMELISVSFK